MPTAAHSSGFMEEHGYLYAFKVSIEVCSTNSAVFVAVLNEYCGL